MLFPLSQLLLVVVFATVVAGAEEKPKVFVSQNYPTYGWGIQNGNQAFITTSPMKFYVRSPGLTGEDGTVSFESATQPDHFLRHFGFELFLEPKDAPRNPNLFNVDATFRPTVKQFGYQQHKSFESVNYPGRYIRHSGYRLRIDPNNNSDLFGKDASFKLKRNLN